MSVQLLDVNVLIALAWPQHMFHERAHTWFERSRLSTPNAGGSVKWATCILTQNAFVRISSNASIVDGAVRPTAARSMLLHYTGDPDHIYWELAPSLSGPLAAELPAELLSGHRQVTDACLLLYATQYDGVLCTFDRKISAAVSGTRFARHVELIG